MKNHLGVFATLADLPNVLGSSTTRTSLEAGDIAYVSGDQILYVCTNPTPGAGVWVPVNPPELVDLTGGTFTRNSVGTYQTGAETLTSAAIDVRRLEDYGDGGGAHLLIEREHTNLLPNNRNLTAGTWSAGTATTTADAAVGPDGAMSADQVDAASGELGPFDGGLTTGLGNWSLWVRAVSGTQRHQTWIGSGNNAETVGLTTMVGTEWTRVNVAQENPLPATVGPSTSDGRDLPNIVGDAPIATAMNVYLDFGQWDRDEVYPRSVIETAGVAATCDPDDLEYAAVDWDDALADGVATHVWRFLWAPNDLASGDVRVIWSMGGANDLVQFRHDGTGVLVEALDGGVAVMASGYINPIKERHEETRITVDVVAATITVDGIVGVVGTSPTWSTAVAGRVGGIQGAAVGSGEEADGRVVEIVGGEVQSFAVTHLPLGDSITVGGNAPSNNGWPKIASLSLNPAIKFQNVGPYRNGTDFDAQHAGVSGDDLVDIAARIATDVVPYSPNVLTLLGGTNDMGAMVGAEAALVRLATLLSSLWAQASFIAYVQVMQIPPQLGSAAAQPPIFNAGIQQVLDDSPWPSGRITMLVPGLVDADISGDLIHPVLSGHTKMGNAVATSLTSWVASL